MKLGFYLFAEYVNMFISSAVMATIFWVLRVVAALGGAAAGWLVMGPVARLLYRGTFRRPAPRWLMPWARLIFFRYSGSAPTSSIPVGPPPTTM